MHLWLMLVLTFTTGIVDAVGYLGLDKVFTGNMTGNVVILGMALVGAEGLPIVGPVLALLGFMAGAALGGRLLRKAGSERGRTSPPGSSPVSAGDARRSPWPCSWPARTRERWLALTVTTLLGGAMGAQAATARFIAVKDVTTVVVTSTITGLAADSVLGSGKGGGSARRALAVVLILAGAAVGRGPAALAHRRRPAARRGDRPGRDRGRRPPIARSHARFRV